MNTKPARVLAALTAAILMSIAASPAAASNPGWVAYKSPLGFELNHPAGWMVETPGGKNVVVRSPDGTSFAVIAPFLEHKLNCRQYLQASFAASLKRFPHAQIRNLTQFHDTPDEALSSFVFNDGKSRASALCSLSGGSGMVFAIAAPDAQFDREQPDLVKIVQSFTVTGRSAAAGRSAGGAGIRYVQWREPNEGAGTVDMPAGWRAEGGMSRRSTIDIGFGVRMISPDGQTLIFLGDPSLRQCITPDSLIMRAPEGTYYNPGYGTALLILHYMPGVVFAHNYAPRFVQSAGGLTGIKIRDQRQRPDIAATYNRQNAQQTWNPKGPPRTTSGEVSFSGERNGREMAGYVLASTTATPGPMGYNWQAAVMGFITPIAQVGTTSAILSHVSQSVRIDPQWNARQHQTTAATSSIVSSTSQAIADMNSSSYWAGRNLRPRTPAATSRPSRRRTKQPRATKTPCWAGCACRIPTPAKPTRPRQERITTGCRRRETSRLVPTIPIVRISTVPN